ncbi:hypothetical protein QEJ31_07645 [Pigmentibacter sp. JX0631]|uniref:hypothetical protein n=1 Tax=Pigmentibacter sp. JX0631 TaxID=2976982 RepID=UPI002469A0C3|nr:hypothetical protein [Pigmentibacter sp. JX0631]WGL61461.1 hypothetical protein QEJ31_07645 [Pigmentibacter sp. JX0631]
MRVNVFSPLSYTWEKFAELQHQYAMLRRRRDVRHADILSEHKLKEMYDDKATSKEIISRNIFKNIYLKKLLHKITIKREIIRELKRIKFEREFLENLRIVGNKIKEHVKDVKYIHKVSLDKYIHQMRIEQEIHVQKDLEKTVGRKKHEKF